MYKLLVIDDEYLVRLGIRETIDWQKHGIEIAGEASDGLEGLDMCLKLKPDVIICDIKMPGMNGGELIKELNKVEAECAIVVLSGYKDFEYAKTALENGAFTYLLKPVDNDELLKAVLVSLERLKAKRKYLNDLRVLNKELPTLKNKIFLDLILANFNDFSEMRTRLEFCGLPVIERGVVAFVRADDGSDSEKSETENAFKEISKILKSRLDGSYIYILERYSDNIAIVIKTDDLKNIKEFFLEALTEYGAKTGITIGISSIFESIGEIKTAYHTAKKISSNKLFLGINTVLMAGDKNYSFHKDVLEAMRYVSKNYAKQISVKAAADYIYVSESHLMHMFKKNVGKTFNEYLADYRITIAKQLLADGKFKIYEIAEIVGYNDVKYFTKVFKKITGITPYEYSKKT